MLEKILKDLPNKLTILRIITIPIIVVSFYIHGQIFRYITAYIFIFASITDYLDGFLARKYNSQTSMGRMLDPIADKMLITATLVMMVDRNLIHVIPALTILCREFFVSGMREYLSILRVHLPVFMMSKVKTCIQMISVSLVLLGDEGTGIRNTQIVGNMGIWISAILTVISGLAYLKKTFVTIRNETENIQSK